MSQEAGVYVESHEVLSNWNNELEYLGYILSEIVNPRGLDKQGFVWHQAADLPTIHNALRQASKSRCGKLRAVMNDEQLNRFMYLMRKSRGIRNAVAHHQIPCEQKMKELRSIKDELNRQLQSIINLVASKFNIDHVRVRLFSTLSGRAVNYSPL